MRTILLVDGDVVAYRMAAAVEKRSVVVTHKASDTSKEFANRTEFKAFLKAAKREFVADAYDIVDVQTPEDASHCMFNIKKTLSYIESATFADQLEIHVSGKGNFRDELLAPKKYKWNRKDTIRPVYLTEAKEYIVNKYKAKVSSGMEADDTLNIRAYEEIAKGNHPIISSNDKDTLNSSGVSFYDWTQETPELFEIPSIGWLTLNKSTVKGCGLKFFAYQLLNGDSVDGYKPSEAAGGGYGSTSAFKALDSLWEPPEILGEVIRQYKEWYGDGITYTAWNGTEVTATWQDMLSLYFKFAYMKRSWNDPSDFRLFFADQGVIIDD